VPVPESGTVCGLAPPSSDTLTEADRAPFAVGLNVTVIVQLAFPGTAEPQLLLSWKSPGLAPDKAIWLMFNVFVPTLVSVIVAGPLWVPTFSFPKLTATGEKTATVPVPESLIFCGLPLALSVTAIDPVLMPAFVGAKDQGGGG